MCVSLLMLSVLWRHTCTRYVILAKEWTWLPDNGVMWTETCWSSFYNLNYFNTLRTGDANLRFYITTAQDGWRKSAFLTRTCFPCTIHLTFRHRASCILGQAFHYSPENAFYIFNQQIYFIIWYLLDLHHWYKLYRQPTRCNNNGLLIIPISSTCFGQLFYPSSGALDCVLQLVFESFVIKILFYLQGGAYFWK